MHTPVITPVQMYDAEARAIAAGVTGFELMQRAGAAVADQLHARFPVGDVRILCGPGGNGGDGFVAAVRLVELGRSVDVFCTHARDALAGDAARAAAQWQGTVSPIEAAIGSAHAVTLDGVFGAGLSRPLSGAVADLASEPGAIVSVDVSSGVNGLTGQVTGAAFRADLTVTFSALRPAHILSPGRQLCGQVAVIDIGVPVATLLSENAPADWRGALPVLDVATHKHKRGHLVCVTGRAASTGAARMAARAGLRSGAGLVTLACPSSATLVVASHVTAEMLSPFDSAQALGDLIVSVQVVVIGPAAGVHDGTKENVLTVLASPALAVLDADGLSVFQDAPADLFAALRETDVMTPHMGEFRRLFPGLLERADSPIEAALQASALAGCIVLLKGAETVIAAPDGHARINTHATPHLATAGSGDVLAGIIGGLLAQGMTSFDAASAGAWLHGACGRAFGPGLIATDLPGLIPAALRTLETGETPV